MITTLAQESGGFLELHIQVEDADWFGRYDRLEVWRSVLGEAGPYEELSAASFERAYLPADAGQPSGIAGRYLNVDGKFLTLRVNKNYVSTVVFTGPDPRTMQEIAYQIREQAAHVGSYVDAGGGLVIYGAAYGGISSIEVLAGDAVPILGLEVGSIAYGKDPRLPLQPGVQYFFTDYRTEKSYFYKTRFSNRLTNVKSPFSEPFSATQKLGVSPSSVVIGFVKLALPDGRAASSQEVTIYNTFLPQIVEGFTVVGGPKRLVTDDNGYVEFPLVRGIPIDIGVGGTSFVRRVQVPSDPNVLKFDVFDPAYGKDDNFSVQRADLPYADRKTL